MARFVDYFLVVAIIAFFMMLGLVGHKIIEEHGALRKEFPKGSSVKVFNSDIIGKVQYIEFPYVSVLYTDDLNVIHEINVSPDFLTKIK